MEADQIVIMDEEGKLCQDWKTSELLADCSAYEIYSQMEGSWANCVMKEDRKEALIRKYPMRPSRIRRRQQKGRAAPEEACGETPNTGEDR